MRVHSEILPKPDCLNKTSSDCENKSNTSAMSSNSQSNIGPGNNHNNTNKAGAKPLFFDTSLLTMFCRNSGPKDEKSPQLSATGSGQEAVNNKKAKPVEDASRKIKKAEKVELDKNILVKSFKEPGEGDLERLGNKPPEKITASGKIKKTNQKADSGGSNILKALNQKGVPFNIINMNSREKRDERIEAGPSETQFSEDFKNHLSLGGSFFPQNSSSNYVPRAQPQSTQIPSQQQNWLAGDPSWKVPGQNCFPRDLCEIIEDNENDLGELMQKKNFNEPGPFVSRPFFNQPQRAAIPNFLPPSFNGNAYLDGNSQTPFSTPRLQKNVVPYSAMGKRESIVSTDSNHDSDNLTTNHTLNALNNSAFNSSLKMDGDSSYENSARKKSIPNYTALNNQNCYLSNSAKKELFAQQIFLPSRDSPSQSFPLQEEFPNLSFMAINPASISRRTSTTTMEGEPKSASTRGDLNSSYMSKASSEDRMNLNNSLRQSNEENPFDNFIIDLTRIEPDGRTTLMIKNIPNKYHLDLMLQTINKNHKNKYDFFYLPIDFRNNCNVGYAFINFVDTRFIRSFVVEFDGQKWTKFNSEKICSIRYARIQGRQALIQHFQFSSVMNQQDRKLRPLILPKNERNNIEMLVQKQKMRNMEENK